MTSKEEIALQLTLKAIDKMSSLRNSEYNETAKTYNEEFSKQIADFYNTIYNSIKTHHQ